MMTLAQFNTLLERVKKIQGIDTKAIEKIQQAVANGDTKLTFDEVDSFTLAELRKVGFEIDIKDIPFIGEGGEA